MTSVERLVEYSELTDEAALEKQKQEKLPNEWPVKADITATNVSLQYADDGPVVLKDLNFTIQDREKVRFNSIWFRCLASLTYMSLLFGSKTVGFT